MQSPWLNAENCVFFRTKLFVIIMNWSTNISHKGLQRTANEYAEGRRIYKDLISKNNNVDILNFASIILQCWSYYVKINSPRHQHDTERTQKKSGIVAINSCSTISIAVFCLQNLMNWSSHEIPPNVVCMTHLVAKGINLHYLKARLIRDRTSRGRMFAACRRLLFPLLHAEKRRLLNAVPYRVPVSRWIPKILGTRFDRLTHSAHCLT